MGTGSSRVRSLLGSPARGHAHPAWGWVEKGAREEPVDASPEDVEM